MNRTMELDVDTARSTPALSIRQPWAELILRATKSVELRRWETSHRGTIWVHAGREVDRGAVDYFGIPDAFRGGFVGAVTLKDCVLMTPEKWFLWSDRHLGGRHFQPNYWGWLLECPIRFDRPVPAPGRLKLFQPGPDVTEELKAGLAGARKFQGEQ